MADIRVAQPIRLVDLDTGNEADVTAAGNLGIEVRIALPAGTNNIGDVDVLTDPFSLVDDAAFTPATSRVVPFAGELDDTTPDSVDEGDIGAVRMSANRNLYVRIRDNAGNERGLNVDASGNITVNVTGTVTVDTELPTAAALADNASNPTTALMGACLLGFDGTTWDRIYTIADGDAVAAATKGFLVIGTDGTNYQALKTDANGELQVDVLTGGGVDTPTTPANQQLTSSALAAGSSANLDTTDIPSKYCWMATATSSVPFKVVFSTLANSVATQVAVLFGRAGEAVVFRPPHRAFMQAGAPSAGTDGFRAAMTNLDTSEAADVYAAFMYADN